MIEGTMCLSWCDNNTVQRQGDVLSVKHINGSPQDSERASDNADSISRGMCCHLPTSLCQCTRRAILMDEAQHTKLSPNRQKSEASR